MVRVLNLSRFFLLILIVCLTASLSFGATRSKRVKRSTTTATRVAAKKVATKKKPVVKAVKKTTLKSTSRTRKASSKRRITRRRKVVTGGPWKEPTYADSTLGDNVDGEDLVVRRAAVEALGPYNGTVVVADPQTGRILTIVNQKLAFKGGFQPCSTVKIYAALAGLNEGIIDRDTNMRLYGRTSMNLTHALARSNNPYFANIGVKLGYEKIAYYGQLLGLGEKAGLNIEEEELGTIPPGPPANGGMGMMTSFGEGIKLTPLQLAATLSAVANGGTLYYLQYPRSQAEAKQLVPRVKRHLTIQSAIPELMPGMLGATEFGTARRAYYDPNEPIFGKTGTCTDRATPTHLGWFGSFNDVGDRKLVVVVLLTGGRPVNGPVASGIAGQIYRSLSQQRFFVSSQTISPVALISGSW
jgi:cell division protein FtsI/penicillin-binding protein 2